MDVVLFGATGNIGRAIAAELVARDHSVTGVSRSGASGGASRPGIGLRAGDATDPDSVAEVAAGSDAVISAIGPGTGSHRPQPFVAAAHALIAGTRRAGVGRLLVVGGAGGLEVAPGRQAVDSPDFPEAYRANAMAQREALEVYRAVGDLDWTYVAPAAEIGSGPHIGDYQIGHDRMLYAEDGKSHISYADYADGVVDCLEQGTHLRERITLAD
jgi:putative NADH-flavin reductase